MSALDRQRAAVVGVAAALVVVLVLGVGFVAGRASNADGDGSSTSMDSDGLPAGPAGLEDGVPVGFEQSEEGALGAAMAWVPWLLSSPATERPDGIDSVLAEGVESPIPEGLSERLQFVPWAAQVEMQSQTEANVTLLGTPLRGEAGSTLDGGVWPLPATLVWDEEAGDWRVSAIDTTGDLIDGPIRAEDVAGFRVIRSYGGVLAGPVMEEVPGD